jgi:hypothetical protein
MSTFGGMVILQVINIETILKSPEYDREDLAKILQSVQIQEKQKLHMVREYFFFPAVM